MGRDQWLGKSDPFFPLGPCIVTADEIPDPAELMVRSWINGEPRQRYAVRQGEHDVPGIVEFATTVMTFLTGDVLSCGTSPAGLSPIQEGDRVEVEIGGIGRLAVSVTDPLHRAWERDILPVDSAAPARPAAAGR